MANENPNEQRVNEQRKAFKEKHGFSARLIPNAWIGLTVAMNITGGGSGGQLAPVQSSGMLEAVRDDGFIISVGERVVFIPREAVLQMELYNPEDLGIDDLEIGI